MLGYYVMKHAQKHCGHKLQARLPEPKQIIELNLNVIFVV